MKRSKYLLPALLALFALLPAQKSFCQSAGAFDAVLHAAGEEKLSTIERSEKSRSLAVGLGFSPVPGDGLYYTGHPVQGSLALVTGIIGAGFLMALTDDCSEHVEQDDCEALTVPLGALGGAIYGAAYLWDALGTLHYSKSYSTDKIDH